MFSFTDMLAGHTGDIGAPPGYKFIAALVSQKILEILDNRLTGNLPGIYVAFRGVACFRGWQRF